MQIANETSNVESERWVIIGDTVILSLTILGAFFILGNMLANEIRGRAATVRMRLVQALVLSDVVMGISGLVGCCLELSGSPLALDTQSCDGLGVLFVAVIFSQHLWTLSLACATFMILTKPLHPLTSWIEKNWYWSWLVVWIISFGVSVLGHFLYGYVPSGGICYYGNNAGLFAELIQFVPRGIVFVCIAFLYGRLYVFLKRPDTIRTGYSDGSGSSYSRGKKPSFLNSHNSRPRHKSFFQRGHRTVLVEDHHAHSAGSVHSHHSGPKPMPPPLQVIQPDPKKLSEKLADLDTATPTSSRPKLGGKRLSKQQQKELAELPPWERVELPAFQVDGQRYGGAGASALSTSPPPQNTWADWRGFGGRKRPSTSTTQSSGATKVGSITDKSPFASPTRPAFDTKSLGTPTSATFLDRPVSPTSLPPRASISMASGAPLNMTLPTKVTTNGSGSGSDDTAPSTATTAVDPSLPEIVQPANRRRSFEFGQSFSSGVAPDEHQPFGPAPQPFMWSHGDPSPFENGNPIDVRRPSLAVSSASTEVSSVVHAPILTGRRVSIMPMPVSRSSTPRGSLTADQIIKDLPRPPTPKQSALRKNDNDVEKGSMADDDDDADDDDGMDLADFLKQAPPSRNGHDPFVVTNNSENVEYVAESMASYLNRKTALLMLWFPLGYVLLFSVSLIRIIFDFVGQPPTALRAVSRWMIFGQGLLDAIIYGVVEWHTKRVVRKRVRKGTFSPRTSGGHTGGSGIGNALRGLGSGSWRPQSPTSTQKQADNQTSSVGRRNVSPTVSFADPERSILQRLDESKETDLKCSARASV
ncbi:hypothetical protein Q8F55_006747 [Vanrija albida]|uniref:Glucose receptor Git3-like N-terminal domain-containing protein n=1 Tax=Vanrija albida TaxID=181172 RepID=A0ABR3PY00_9TREE